MKPDTIVCDFARVILLPKADVGGSFDVFYSGLVAQGPVDLFDHFTLNDELLAALAVCRRTMPVYMFTGGDIHETDAMLARLKPSFAAIYTSSQVSFSKSDPQAYRKLAAVAGLVPETTLFIDDSPANVSAAQAAGYQTHLFAGNAALLPLLAGLHG